jgi:hypothetical protein
MLGIYNLTYYCLITSNNGNQLSPNLGARCPISKLGISNLKMEGLGILSTISMFLIEPFVVEL